MDQPITSDMSDLSLHPSSATTPNLLTASASDLQSLLTSGSLTSVQLVQQCLAQIAAHDRKPGSAELRAMMFITGTEKLMSIAQALDEEREAGKVRGPFHGVPVVVKDQWQVHPDYGMPNTAGMSALLEARNNDSAVLVKKLEEAGMILLGKTNMSEFGGGKASETVGKSAVGGQCQSPYVPGPAGLVLEHNNPGGSSVGSAVAVAAGYAPISISTEADGSTTTPGARAALYGLVMTRETISLEGYMTISPTYASPGCMAKTAGDLKDLVGVMLEASNAKGMTPLPSEDQLKMEWEGISLGFVNHDYEPIPWAWTKLTEMEILELKSKYEGAIAKIGQSGAKVRYPIDLPPARTDPKFLHDGRPAIGTLVLGEIRWDINAYLESLDSSPVRSLEELIQWNKDHPEAQAGLDQTQHILAQDSTLTKEQHTVLKTKMYRAAGEETIDRVMKELCIDVIVGTMEMCIVSLASLAGYPCATMPLGVFEKSGRPFGLCLIARKHEEGKLLRVMAAYEKTFPPRAIPSLLS